MRLLPKHEDWTPYLYLVYLLFFMAMGLGTPLKTAVASCVAIALYFGAYWFRTARVLWIAAAWFVLAALFIHQNPAASTFFVYAACIYGKIWEPPVAFRVLAGHVTLVGLVCWAMQLNGYVSLSAQLFSALMGTVVIQFA